MCLLAGSGRVTANRRQHPWPSLEIGWLAEHAGVEPVGFRVTSDNHVRSLIRAVSYNEHPTTF